MSELDPKTLKAASDQVLSHIAGMTGLDGMLRAIAHEVQALASIPGAEKGADEGKLWKSLATVLEVYCLDTVQIHHVLNKVQNLVSAVRSPAPTSERVQVLEALQAVADDVLDVGSAAYIHEPVLVKVKAAIAALKATP